MEASEVIRKQTKIWKTSAGEKIRVCDMDDLHLENSIKLLQKIAMQKRESALLSAYMVESILQGEMALASIEVEIRRLEESVPEDFLPDIYLALLLERRRRMLIKESVPLPWH